MKLGMLLPVKYKTDVNVTLVDSRTGKIDEEINLGSNMILAEHYENVMKNGSRLLPAFSEVRVGDDDTAPELSQTGLKGNEIDSSTDREETVEIDDMYRDWPAILSEYTKHSNTVYSVAWNSDDSKIASGSWDDTVHIFDAETGDKILEYDEHSDNVNSVAWSSDDSKIASGNWNGNVHIFDADTGDKILEYTEHSDSVNKIAWSSDDSKIASASADGTVHIFDAETGDKILEYTEHSSDVNSVAWNSDDSKIASGSDDDTVHIFDAETGDKILEYDEHSDNVNSVAWSSDDSKIASGNWNGNVHIFDAETGDKILEYDEHSNTVYSVAWNSDDSKIASGSDDDTVHIFDAETGDKILEYDEHSNTVYSVAWNSDDSKIASGSYNNTVHVYKVQKESGDLFDTVSRAYTFYFPASESGAGNIKEFYNDAGARITYSDGIDKKEYHEMYVEWVWTVELSDREFTGTITDGQRDGETDINYKISIDNRQFIDLCQENNLLTDNAVVGTSNDDNGLVEDVKNPILGEEIFDGSLWHHETEDYVDDSYEREWRIGFEYDEANHEDGIGEILLGSRGNPLIRITFDPPLDKIYDDNNQWRLYLDFLALIDPDAQTSSIDVVEEE